ncbi:unnamed protein product [Acanthoscelides obtectus]|uniref:Uncharacterized protein n=1 Tax=Acanthoscelides obtectus TaxID=200917 RepID=A0A9P0Q8W3_ACAOB|nr:unnamed protein product [Acanthoscelides obtectus]CAH2014589.1 unnamed protein product [Acanthoscelides obtectus]CAK1623357.1 hypothetical protein AOBTE_LOCUS1952 [Acanthoscelides obtectus]CAK1623376.1 hypothetical protein AOBTE_LOCUS1963 [Acanthoscelides obtectus]
MKWCAERPLAAIFIVIVSTVMVLPLITAAVLMPIAILMDFGSYLGNKGFLLNIKQGMVCG